MTTVTGQDVWGIVGGLGPMASAVFLQTVYEQFVNVPEQELPSCLMISDPTFPDRTPLLLRGEYDELTRRLEEALSKLVAMGANRLLIACVTIHAVLPRVSEALRQKVTSLLEVSAAEVLARDSPQLLACTLGTYELRLFQNLGPEVTKRVVVPAPEDRKRIHQVIYEIKLGHPLEKSVNVFQSLVEKYQIDSVLAGCTELHILSRAMSGRLNFSIIDPLEIVASRHMTFPVNSRGHG